MTTRETVEGYFDGVRQARGWDRFLAEGMTFTSFTSPMKQVPGKEAYLKATQRFYSMIASMAVKELMVDGEKACALTRYELRPPVGEPFSSDVAEVFTVKEGRIEALAIYFDTAPFPK